tara:strand:- start:196 stop:456 length:261 start_codon:yes stop_codon:yes gene_type:complete
MGKVKEHLMDLEEAVLDVSGEAYDRMDLKGVLEKNYVHYYPMFVEQVVKLLRKQNHPLADDTWLEDVAIKYYMEEILGIEWDFAKE